MTYHHEPARSNAVVNQTYFQNSTPAAQQPATLISFEWQSAVEHTTIG